MFNIGESKVFHYGSAKQKKSAILFLHGFPADSGKNEDIAEGLSKSELDVDCYIIHYAGLGLSNGIFSFCQSIIDSTELAETLIKMDYKSLYLVGHSWGGLVSLNIMNSLQKCINSCILLAPVTLLPNEEVTREMLSTFIKSREVNGTLYSLDILLDEYKIIRSQYNPFKIFTNLSGKNISIIQGLNDVVTPPNGSRSFSKLFFPAIPVEEVDDDHWFNNDRNRIYNLIFDKIKASQFLY